MHHLAYISSATRPFSEEEIEALLSKARAKNARLGVTGLLIYRDGNFIQILEGEREAVEDLFKTIQRDPRHHDVILIDQEELTERQFSDWAMNFRKRSGGQLFSEQELAGDSTGYLRMLQRLVTNMR